jgi:hypothetical protein
LTLLKTTLYYNVLDGAFYLKVKINFGETNYIEKMKKRGLKTEEALRNLFAAFIAAC